MNLFKKIVENKWFKVGLLNSSRTSVFNPKYLQEYPLDYNVSDIKYGEDFYGYRTCIKTESEGQEIYYGVYGGNGARIISNEASNVKWGRGSYNYVGEVPNDIVCDRLERYRVYQLPNEITKLELYAEAYNFAEKTGCIQMLVFDKYFKYMYGTVNTDANVIGDNKTRYYTYSSKAVGMMRLRPSELPFTISGYLEKGYYIVLFNPITYTGFSYNGKSLFKKDEVDVKISAFNITSNEFENLRAVTSYSYKNYSKIGTKRVIDREDLITDVNYIKDSYVFTFYPLMFDSNQNFETMQYPYMSEITTIDLDREYEKLKTYCSDLLTPGRHIDKEDYQLSAGIEAVERRYDGIKARIFPYYSPSICVNNLFIQNETRQDVITARVNAGFESYPEESCNFKYSDGFYNRPKLVVRKALDTYNYVFYYFKYCLETYGVIVDDIDNIQIKVKLEYLDEDYNIKCLKKYFLVFPEYAQDLSSRIGTKEILINTIVDYVIDKEHFLYNSLVKRTSKPVRENVPEINNSGELDLSKETILLKTIKEEEKEIFDITKLTTDDYVNINYLGSKLALWGRNKEFRKYTSKGDYKVIDTVVCNSFNGYNTSNIDYTSFRINSIYPGVYSDALYSSQLEADSELIISIPSNPGYMYFEKFYAGGEDKSGNIIESTITVPKEEIKVDDKGNIILPEIDISNGVNTEEIKKEIEEQLKDKVESGEITEEEAEKKEEEILEDNKNNGSGGKEVEVEVDLGIIVDEDKLQGELEKDEDGNEFIEVEVVITVTDSTGKKHKIRKKIFLVNPRGKNNSVNTMFDLSMLDLPASVIIDKVQVSVEPTDKDISDSLITEGEITIKDTVSAPSQDAMENVEPEKPIKGYVETFNIEDFFMIRKTKSRKSRVIWTDKVNVTDGISGVRKTKSRKSRVIWTDSVNVIEEIKANKNEENI
jgi:hypothetical protein